MIEYYFYRVNDKKNKSVFSWSIEQVDHKRRMIGTSAMKYATDLARREKNKEILLSDPTFSYAILVRANGDYDIIYRSNS